jgi:hypothetical protein
VVNEVDNQDKTFVSRADFLPFFYAICLGQNPARRHSLPQRTYIIEERKGQGAKPKTA